MSVHITFEAGSVVHMHCCECADDTQEPPPPPPPPPPAALQALNELIHMANLHLPDGSTVTLQVEVLRPRLLAIRAALTGAP